MELFLQKVDAGEILLTTDSFLNKANEFDCSYGDRFNPPK